MGETRTETEVKLEVHDLDAVRDSLRRIGAELVGPRELEDNVLLDDAAGRLTSGGEALRVRAVGGRGVFTYKGPKLASGAGIKTRRELEVSVDDPARLREILDALGYEVRFRYQKYRETWRLGACEIVVDETPIGCFVEIEGTEEAIHEVASALGFGRSAYIDLSYASLFFSRGGQGDMVFPQGGAR